MYKIYKAFFNFSFLGVIEDYGNDQAILETKQKFQHFFVNKVKKPNTVSKNEDQMIVSAHVEYGPTLKKHYTRHHMIGDKTNKDLNTKQRLKDQDFRMYALEFEEKMKGLYSLTPIKVKKQLNA